MIRDREEVDLDPAEQLGMITALVGNTAHPARYLLRSLIDLEGLFPP